MLVSLTVGKVDAGVAVLLTEDKRLIEFPSILLPPDIQSGSIVDINVARNQKAESVADQRFSTLQAEIFETFGSKSPSPPVLRCRNATQTSVVLEWDPIELATAEFRSLSLHRNGTKAGNIPRDKLSTKISGLALDTEYTFHLVLRTSAGQYTSEKLNIKTHKMTDLHGITITPGVMPSQLKDSLAETISKIGAKMVDTVRIDTTHFVCTEPRGQAWEKAVEMNVPVVVPDWVKGCEREGRIVGVRGYYLDADPKLRQMGPSTHQQRGSVSSIPARVSPTIQTTPPTPERTNPVRDQNDSNSSLPDRPAPPPKQLSYDGARSADDAPSETSVTEKQVTSASASDGESDDTERGSEDRAVSKDASRQLSSDEASSSKPPETPGDDGQFSEVEL